MIKKELKNNKLFYSIIIIVLLLVMTLGYSVLKTTLTINGDTKIQKNSWIIYFDDVNIASDSVKNEDTTLDAKITNREKTNIKFTANLQNPGDFYEFTVYTVNDGTIDAAISSIEKSTLTDEQLKYLEFDVRYDDGEEIKRCDILKANDRRLIKAVVKFKEGLDTNDYPTEGVSLSLFFKINYEQNVDCEITPSNVKHKLTINPAGGIYEKRKAPIRIYLTEGTEYTLSEPTRELYNFKYWTVKNPTENGTFTLNDNKFKMGKEDVEIEAEWIEGDYVARIMNTYYKTIQEAFDAAGDEWEDNTVHLIRNVSENPTNNTAKPFTFNLEGKTLTGTITNSKVSNIDLVNGTVKADSNHDEAFVNYGVLLLGEQGLPMVTENSIKLVGNSVGLRNVKTDDNVGEFYFYDGYIEGTVGIVGGYTDKEDKYYVFAEHVSEKNAQRVYLIRNPNRAVAKTETEGEIYYYNLQDAINAAEENKKINTSLTDDDYIVKVIREFEAAYELEVHDDSRVVIDLAGHDVSIGEEVTNNGYLKITNSSDANSKIRVSSSIVNESDLILDNINISATTDTNIIKNTSNLVLNNSTVTSKNGYGVYNEEPGTVTMDSTSVLNSIDGYGLYNSSSSFEISNGNIYGLYNDGTASLTGSVKVHNTNNNYAVQNNGTLNVNGGQIIDNKDEVLINNIGTVNANDGIISAKNTAISGGKINVNGSSVSSNNGPTINSLDVTVNDGLVTSDEGTAIYSEAKVVNGVKYIGKVTVNGGTVDGNDYAINSNEITITEGTITSNDVAVKDYTYTYTYNNVKYTINGKTNISGGNISGDNTGVVSDNLTMSDGTIDSENGIGALVNKEGTITGGTIAGNTYGLDNKGIVTLGTNDKNIVSNNPSVTGELYGLYNEGTEVNFYDGELIGETDSHYGKITGTPTGGTIFKTEIDNDGTIYQKEYVSGFENWLKVGDNEYNNLDDASNVAQDGETIIVTKNVDITFVQNVLGNDKNIILDLNGKTITSSQTIINESNLTIIDSSQEKTGSINPNRVEGITNNNKLIISGGNYYSNTDNSIVNNGEMIINNANIKANEIAIINNDNLVINNVNITDTKIGVNNNKTVEMKNGSINVSDIGINNLNNSDDVIVSGGSINAINYGIYGDYGDITISGGSINSTNNNAINTYFGSITVNDGTITSEKNVSISSHNDITINGGEITGTIGIKNELYCPNKNSNYNCSYKTITVNDGRIIGTTNEGIDMTGNTTSGKLNVYGGTIEGNTDGIKTSAEIQIGKDDKNISIEKPEIIGHTNYGLKTTAYTSFYDGILKGITSGYDGLINIIPEASLIDHDYEFINKIEYQTYFLTEKGNFLKVGTEEFNSINKAYKAIEGTEGTITVIRDAYIDYAQSIPSGKKVTFDINGHSLVMTQPLEISGDVTITNDSTSGGINNISDTTIKNTGTLKITGGTFNSDEKHGIENEGTLTIDGATINSSKEYGVNNKGTLIVENGNITGEKKSAIYSTNKVTINNGNISTLDSNAVTIKASSLTINNGSITSDKEAGIYVQGNSTITVNGGDITGKTYGLIDNNASGKLDITGGHLLGETQAGLNTYTNTNITGGVIEGFTYGIYSAGSSTTTNIGNNDGIISIDSPVLKGDSYGLYVQEGNVNFYDGIIKGITDRYYGNINALADNAQIFEDTEISDKKNYLTDYLIAETEVAININTNKKYGNLQTAINEVGSNETIELLTNVPLYYDTTIASGKQFTLDLKGYTISANKSITNNGNVTITNTSSNESSIKTSGSISIFTNKKTLTINNVGLKNSSSSNYVITNEGTLTTNNVNIDSISGINNSNNITLNNTDVKASKIAVNNTGKLEINNGIYNGTNYSIYSNTTKNVNITGATLYGVFYNSGNNESIFSSGTINSNIQNNISKLNILNSNINTSKITNNGNLILEGSTYTNTIGSTSQSSLDTAITNSNTMIIDNSNIIVNQSEVGKHSQAILNTKDLTIKNGSNIKIGSNNTNYEYRGITNQGNGNIEISDSEIDVVGGSISYGIYSNSANAKATIITGKIDVEKAINAYGVYANTGTFEMGHYEGTGGAAANVSTTDPLIYVQGERGIGVKKINGSFNFYDGIIEASKFAKPETTTNVEYQYEVTTYVDEETGFEYALLEFMGNDYQGDTVALLNGVYYKTVQDAIDKAEEGSIIYLLKSVSENLVIPTGTYVELDLNKHSITTNLINSGTFNVYNGSLQNFDKNTIVNYGTVILGENDGVVTSSTIRIISETTTIVNEGTLIMYDGYIEGEKAVEGEINQIADYARIRVEQDVQSEKKYIQSLSETAIRNHETDLIITVNPNYGIYEGSKEKLEVFKKYEETYTLSIPTKRGCNFLGWEVSEEDVLSGSGTTSDPYVITVGLKDITVTAKWKIDENAVAKIENDYYLSVQEAFDSAEDNDVIELIKDTEESPINRKTVTLNLGNHTLTGKVINNGDLAIIHGTIENPSGPALENNRNLTIGDNDGEMIEDDVKIIGSDVGLEQNGRFNFFDGYIEGDVALNGKVDKVPHGYFIYNDHNIDKDCQKVYLIGNPENAVAETRVGGTQYFFSLQDAIDTSTKTGYEIYLRRDDFEATYPLIVGEGANIVLNTNGHDFSVGDSITNNGTWKIYNGWTGQTTINSARTIENNGTMIIEDVIFHETNTDNYAVLNNGDLNLNNSTLISKNNYTVYTNGTVTIEGDSYVTSESTYGIYNNQTEPLVLEAGTISGIDNPKELVLGGTVVIDTLDNQNIYGINMYYNNCKLTMNDGEINSYKSSINSYLDNQNLAHGNTIIINDGKVTSTKESALYVRAYTSKSNQYPNTPNHITINDGEFSGYQYAINVNNNNYVDINGGSYTYTYDYSGYYPIYCASNYQCDVKNATINTAGYGIYISGYSAEVDTTIKNVEINMTGKSTNYGISLNNVAAKNYVIEDVIITGKNQSSAGMYLNGNTNSSNFYLNNVNVDVGGTGINCSTGTTYINSGYIKGENYGISSSSSSTVINVGDKNREYSKEELVITGGLYGVNSGAKVNFYNGILRGSTYGYRNSLAELRKGKIIAEDIEYVPEADIWNTKTTTSSSATATKNYAKQGTGYARITYIGETTEICTNNQIFNYAYTGATEEFNVPCTGRYILEVWGSASNNNRSYGGYSYGEIELTENETLYITVGGQGGYKGTTSGTYIVNGGFNGGGDVYVTNYVYENSNNRLYIYGSGGATHIATAPGLLNELEDNKDSILIVAGGAGSGTTYGTGSYSYHYGGAGGGYIGGTPSTYYGTGGTQTEPGFDQSSFTEQGKGSFGRGADSYGTMGNAGGGGYYGGGGTGSVTTTSGGGSGYIANSRIENGIMYGYNVKELIRSYVINYLEDKEVFLRVGDKYFNSFDDAVEYIDEEGTIVVIKDAELSEQGTIPSGKNITLDIDGKNLVTTSEFINEGTFKIVDNSNDKTGTITNNLSEFIDNRGTFTLDGIVLKVKNNVINSTTTNGVVNIYDSKITGSRLLNTNNNQTITVNNTEATTTNEFIFNNGKGLNLSINNSDITSTNSYCIYSSQSNSSSTISIKNSDINAYSYGIYNYGSSSTFLLENSNVTSTNNYGVYFYNGSVTGTFNNSNVESKKTTGVYLYSSGNIEFNGGNYKGVGAAVDIYSSGTYTFNSGTYEGSTVGLDIRNSATVNIGNLEDELNKENPMFIGQSYGVRIQYAYAKTNFYNGILKGRIYGYSGNFANIRPNNDVVEENSLSEEDKISMTYSTTSASSAVAKDVPKYGDGYARITYLGEDNDKCYTNDTYNYNYINGEETFTVPCTGKYLLEVWGAGSQSANSSYHPAAPGGYSTGEIMLNKDEVLYINVGGQGTYTNSNNVTTPGGYNGGGSATSKWNSYRVLSVSGGGATHIATASGELYELENNKDSVLIVSGGAGGGSYYSYNERGFGGAGGGYIANNGTVNTGTFANYGTGATQTEGGHNNLNPDMGIGTFGKGADTIVTIDTRIYGGAGGGGWYGGGSGGTNGQASTSMINDFGGGGGGSGYTGNSRLINPHMTGYSVESNIWITNYLSSNDGFLEVDGVIYNTFDDAIDAIDANGTIKVIANGTVNTAVTIPAGKNITLDLNNKKVVMNDTFKNLSNLIITDSSESKNGILQNTKDSGVSNYKNLTTEYVTISSSCNYSTCGGISNHVDDGNIEIRNNTIINGIYGILLNSNKNVSVTIYNSTIESKSYGINNKLRDSSLDIYGTTIKADNITVLLDNNNGNNDVTINDSFLLSSNNRGFQDSNTKNTQERRNDIKIYNTNIISSTSGIYTLYSDVDIKNVDIELGGSNTEYAIYCGTSSICEMNDIDINSKNGPAIYTTNDLTITDANIECYNTGININTGNLTLNNVNIKTTSKNAGYGIYATNYETDIVLNNTNIETKNIGVFLGNTQNSRKTLQFNTGSIVGELYGIYQGLEDSLVVIGNENDPVSIENPSLEGGLYSIYRTDGELYFYSGILKGYIKGTPSSINIIRDGYEVYETTDEMQMYLQKNRNINAEAASEEPLPNTAKIGNGYAKVTYIENVASIDPEDLIYENIDCESMIGKEYKYLSIKEAQKFTSVCPGTYKLEVWGAQGKGRGGYASGYLDLTIGEELYVYVGSSGNNGGYNGGGTGPNGTMGGGATDIRLNSSLYSRIIVAGGGGNSGTAAGGGAGGGTAGAEGGGWNGYSSSASGGTQTGGGGSYGSFGQGGSYIGGAGGGGWYGGGGSSSVQQGGGGGSGYVLTATSTKPSGYLVGEKYYMYDTTLIAGSSKVPSHDGTYQMLGNEGDGYAKITFIKRKANAKQLEVNLVSSKGTIENSTLIYSRGDKLGDIPTPTNVDENLSFIGWYADSDFTKKVTADTIVDNSMVIYAKFTYNDEYCISLVNNVYNFDYTNGMQTLDILCPGKYKLEAWGAQGGNSTFLENSNTGGYGGYSVGEINLEKGEKLYIAVGGQGQSAVVESPSGCTTYSCRKITYSTTYGYNGGGYAGASYNNSSTLKYNGAYGGGGGATHIATEDNTLRYLTGSEDALLIVAGGGGGASTNELYPSYSGDGGHAGGLNAGNAILYSTTCETYGTGATSTKVGSYATCLNASGTYRNSSQIYPTFGLGSNKFSSSNNYYSGGGGGYYGGGSGYYAPAGGGTGYIGSYRLHNKAMYAYESENSYMQDYSNIAYLVETTTTIHNKTQDLSYKNMQTAFNEAHDGDIIELLDDTVLSYDTHIYDGTKITIDLNGHSLKTFKSITNDGDLTITSEISGSNLNSRTIDPSVVNNGILNINNIDILGNYALRNESTGDMTIDNINMDVDNLGIMNNGKMTLTNSSIKGDLYAIYSNASYQEVITNSKLSSNQTAYYKYSTEKTIITNSTINGQINNAKTNAILEINGGSINDYIENSGNTTIDGTNISFTTSIEENETAINNPGILNIKNSTITHKNKNNCFESDRTVVTIENSGTLISTDNEYNLSHELNNVRNKSISVIHNTSILNSTRDKYTVTGGELGAAINSDSENTSSVTNATIKVYDSNNSYGLYSTSGSIKLTGGTIESYNSKYSGGIYSLAGSPILNNVTINIHDSEIESYGIYAAGGEVTIETGSVHSTGNIAYGAYITKGTLVLGIEDGRGTEAADVSITNPYVEAIGTTTGIAIRQGDGSFKFYDGYITGSTSPRVDGDITTATDKNYQVVTKTDELTGYNYCILEFMK